MRHCARILDGIKIINNKANMTHVLTRAHCKRKRVNYHLDFCGEDCSVSWQSRQDILREGDSSFNGPLQNGKLMYYSERP